MTLRRALLLLVCVSLFACRGGERTVEQTAAAGPIIIISIDTLRADHLPLYGARGVETPTIDAIAKDAIVFDNAYSHVPLTFPSHVTILTGLLPEANGIRNNLGYRFDSAAHPSVPTLLKAKGYVTGAAVSAYVLRGATGLAAAFDDYDDQMDRATEGGAVGDVQRSGAETVDAAIRWVDAKRGQNLFYLLHLFEPHSPYAPPEPFKTRYAASPYDGEIAAADAYVGRFLDTLKKDGLYDAATIVLLSDHGEGLGDHGEEQHGIFLYREAIHVPLLLKLPKNEMKGTRVQAPVQLIDVLPTIAAIAGVQVPNAAKGVSLIDVARGKGPADRRIYSETMYPRIHLGWSDLASLVDARHHYIDAPRPELYDVAADVQEKKNILADERRVFASMRSEVATHDRTLKPPSSADPEEAAKLAALGYLGSSSTTSASGPLIDPKDGIVDFDRVGRARALINQGKFGEAVAILRDVTSRNPSFADAWTLLAKTLERIGRTDEALDAYKKTMIVAPLLSPGTAMSMAELFIREGKFDDSIKHAEIALPVHPVAARLIIAEAHLGKRDLAAAERESSMLVDDPAKGNDARVLLAQIRIAERRFPEALAILDEVRQRASTSTDGVPPNYWFARGDALARLDRLPEAEQAFAEEIRRYPRNREAYVRLAVLEVLSGRDGDAHKTFDLMIRNNPEPSSRTLAAETFKSLRR